MTEAQAKELETTASDAGQGGEQTKTWTPEHKNPRGFHSKLLRDNSRMRLMVNDEGAWVIRFDNPPNNMEGYSKENPHPVLAFLKRDERYKFGFDADGKGGWGIIGPSLEEAQRVFDKAAEIVGVKGAERTPF